MRNDSDIVEAYEFEVVGECAPWTSVEPARLSLYPGTSDQVAVLLRPPRSSEVRAGEVPLGVRVLPAERPESVVVSETTVVVEPFLQQHAELVPERRRAWRSARFHVEVHNDGNTPITAALVAAESDDQLHVTVPAEPTTVDPGVRVELPVRARVGKVLWFGSPLAWPVRLTTTSTAASAVLPASGEAAQSEELEGELLQLPVFPKWLLALLALLLALLLAWLLLVRPAVRSAAREATDDRAGELVEAGRQEAAAAQNEQPQQRQQGGEQPPSGQQQEQQGQPGQPGQRDAVGGEQSSNTIEVRTNTGDQGTGSYVVPAGKVFRITDLVLANHQGDEGVLTIAFGERTVTTIALETFRNQDYHWVTPIDVPENSTVSATVNCARPGTPASGQQAPNCLQLLNVSGALADVPQG
ncbi:hydrolytic protein [Umezawaea sp.]|uniref:COG1470 family protein n=1 Tax=Umezawaea sp. TaxID=1955258 RepID=UPI002ED43B9C